MPLYSSRPRLSQARKTSQKTSISENHKLQQHRIHRPNTSMDIMADRDKVRTLFNLPSEPMGDE